MADTSNGSATALDAASAAAAITAVLAGELQIDPALIEPDAVLKQLPGADSVRLMRVVARVERDFQVEFEDEDVFRIRTVKELLTLVLDQVGGR